MSKFGFLLVDGNNIGNIHQNTNVLSAGGMQTQAVYGFARTMRALKMKYPMLTPIVLWDGKSWRYDAFPSYKESRNKPAVQKYEIAAAQNRTRWKEQQPWVRKLLVALGIRQMIALNLEADDLAGVLVRRYQPQGRKIILITGDKDWLQLVEPGVGWFDPVRDNLVTSSNFPAKVGYHRKVKGELGADGKPLLEWRGCPSAKAFLDVKALQGDGSDDIPGVGGIGEAGAFEIIIEHGSVAELGNKWVDKTIDAKKTPKKIRDFLEMNEKQEIYRRNLMLMDLRSSQIPDPVGLRLTHQEVDPAAAESLCQALQFQSILNDFAGWLEPFQAASFVPQVEQRKAA